MSEIKTDELTQTAETGNAATETPIVEEINEPKEKSIKITKNTIIDFFKKCFSKENLKKTIAVILLAAIVIGGICGVISYNSPKSVALRFIKADCEFNLKAEEKLLAYDYRTATLYDNEYENREEAFFEHLSDVYDEDINSWEDYFKVYQKQNLENMEDSFGDYKYIYNVSRIKDISVRKVKEENKSLLSSLERAVDFDADTIEEGKKVTVKIKLDSEDEGIVRFTAYVTLVKASGSWKILNWSDSD